MAFATQFLDTATEVTAPDGSAVRILVRTTRGSMAHFSLPPFAVSRPVAHHTVEEVWYFLSGTGRMWRRSGGGEEVVTVGPGVSISLPVGTAFQFRSDSDEPLQAVGVTMPPWSGDDEAYVVEGIWEPSA